MREQTNDNEKRAGNSYADSTGPVRLVYYCALTNLLPAGLFLLNWIYNGVMPTAIGWANLFFGFGSLFYLVYLKNKPNVQHEARRNET